jgi:nitrous oxide reductase accessory protein NosL
MLLYNDEHQEDVLTFWVRDYKNEKWVGSDLANLVINGDITTPMMHGIIALEDPDQAKNLAIEINGKVISFDELLEHHNSMDHEHHD